MNSFWIAVGLSLVASFAYILLSIQMQNTQVAKDGSISSNKLTDFISMPLFGVFLLLVLTPIGYYSWGNMKKQQDWLSAQRHFEQIVQGKHFSNNENDIQQLILSLRTAVATDPENGQLWFMLANSFFQLRMIDLADAAMERALRIEMRPDWLVANAQILSVTNQDSDIAKATNLLKNALSIAPNHQGAMLTLGFIYLRQQQYQLAIATWEKLQRLLDAAGNNTETLQRQIEIARKGLAKQQE